MQLEPPIGECSEPAQAALVEPYCLGDLKEEDQQSFEAHLLSCPGCWRAVQRLQSHVDVLMSDRQLTETILRPDAVGVLGTSGAMERPLSGHLRPVLVAGALFGLLFAVPVVVEVAYQFDAYGQRALTLAPLAFVWMLAATLVACHVDVRAIRQRSGQFWRPLLVLLAATAMLCAAILPLLPAEPTVAANFQTYPTRLGYLKSVFYAWMVGPWLAFWPFHFVVAMQAQLTRGNHAYVLGILNRDKAAVPPRGLPFVPVWAFAVYVAGLFVFNYVGVAHLFDNLRSGPYMSLFMTLVLVRVTAWLSLATAGVLWYAMSLTELKRECLAVLSLTRHSPGKPITPSRRID